MADRTCERCRRVFKYPSELRSHQKRKRPCAPILTKDEQPLREQAKIHACKFCGRRFTMAQSMYRHIRNTCEIAGSEEGMELLYEHTLQRQLERHQQETAEVKAELAEIKALLKTQVLAIPGKQNRCTIQQNSATVQQVVNGPVQNVNVNINVFGQEDASHIDRASVKELFDDILSAPQQSAAQAAQIALIKAAALIYSDPARPENLTCYIPNKKKGDVMVHGESGWEIQPCPLVLPPMVTKSLDMLFQNQPFEEADKYCDLMKALRVNEKAYREGKEMTMILIRNKDLLEKALGNLPH